MKICIWSGSSFEQLYASYHLLESLIINLLDDGHEVYLVQKQVSNGELPLSLKNRINLHVLNIKDNKVVKDKFVKRYLDSLNYYYKSWKVLKKIKMIDKIFLQSNFTPWFPIMLLKFAGIPIVYNNQDAFPDNAVAIGALKENSLITNICKFLQKFAYKSSSDLITISDDMKDIMCREYGCADEKVKVAYNWGHDIGNIIEKNNMFLKRYPKSENEKRIVYAGNIGYLQNVDVLLEAAKILIKYDDNIKFYIIGSGVEADNLKNKAENWGLLNVSFLPIQPPELINDVYSSADINIIPLRKDVIYTALPSKTADCLNANSPIIFCINKESKFAKLLGEYDIPVVQSGEGGELAESILNVLKNGWCGRTGDLLHDKFASENNIKIYVDAITKRDFK